MCCCMGMPSGIFILAHALLLLTVSFFVLLAALKSDSQGLKTFGVVIAALLWIATALALGKAITNRQCKMGRMNMMGPGMQQANNPVPTK